jgi:hypothetical protein
MKVKLKKHNWSKWRYLTKPLYGTIQNDNSILTICKTRYLWLNGMRIMYLIEYPHKDIDVSFNANKLDLSCFTTESLIKENEDG